MRLSEQEHVLPFVKANLIDEHLAFFLTGVVWLGGLGAALTGAQKPFFLFRASSNTCCDGSLP